MAEVYMAPRSYAYSGGDLSDVAMGTAPATQSQPQGGGFLAGLERFAGAVLPIAEAAVAFQQGRKGQLPLPGRSPNQRPLAGQLFMYKVLEDMRARSDAAAERARSDRERARQQDLQNQILLKAYENKELSLDEVMRRIQGGAAMETEQLPTQAPSAPAAAG